MIKKKYICQHHIDYNNLNKFKKYDENKYSENLFKFINKYSYLKNNTYICKSCNELLDVKRYIVNVYSLSDEGINININSNVDFKENKKYKNYSRLIQFIDKLIDKIALITNLNIFIGNSNESKFNRKKI